MPQPFESCRIEFEEEFDDAVELDRFVALQKVAKMVEGYCVLREKYPEKFL